MKNHLNTFGNAKYCGRVDVQLEEWEKEENMKGLECGSACFNMRFGESET